MERPMRLVSWGLIAALALLVSSCGGGGGGGSSQPDAPTATPAPSLTPGVLQPTPTTTPLPPGTGRNERTETSAVGSITLRLEEIDLTANQPTAFSVFLRDANGRPAANEAISIETALELVSMDPPTGVTRADGTVSGVLRSRSGGLFPVTATPSGENSRFRELSVTLTVVVSGPSGRTPTATPVATRTATLTPEPTLTSIPTPTATALPCEDVQTIIVQTDTFNVGGQTGGQPRITAVVFDSDNRPVGGVNVLFDVQPRVGSFQELVKTTGRDGTVSTQMNIPANTTFGTLTVSASACQRTGGVSINVVSGGSSKPVRTVVLEAEPQAIGSDSGGTVNLKAAVLDADNQPINGIDVLFITTVGRINPLIDRTRVAGAEGGIATSIVQIPVGAVPQVEPYPITALAGGVTGLTGVRIVSGRVPPGGVIRPGVPPGEPANIQLGASPTRIQISGTGGQEVATVLAKVIDNNGNPLAGARVRFHVVTGQSAPGAVILPGTQPVPTGTPGTPTPVPSTGCALGDPSAVSDTAGFASLQVRAGSSPGAVTVSACTDTTIFGVPQPLIEQQAVVTITSGPVSRIALTMNSRFITNNDGSLLVTLTAIVTDAQGNVVEDGTPVFFEILPRKVCSGGSNDGQACSTSATCSGGTCADDFSDPSLNVAVSSNTTTNGLPPCDVSQYVVQTGLPVSPQPGDAITCVKFPLLQQATEVRIRASAAGVYNNLAGQTLTLPGLLSDLTVSVNPATIRVSDLADTLAIVRATAFDANFDGLENVRVRFTTSVGSIDRSSVTDVNGETTATLIIPAGTPSGSVTLRVSAGGLQITDVTVPIVNIGGGATPTPGSSAQPAGLQFVEAVPNVIGVRGSGLPEQSVLTFQVTDGLGKPVAGAIVDFSLARVSGESITPNQTVSDTDGEVKVTLTSGQRALSLQVTAEVDAVSPPLVTRSTAVSVLGGPPSQPNFSLAHQFANISGRVTFGLTNEIRAFVADRFGNPVPPDTAVSFTTQFGAVGEPTLTNTLGQAKATLVSQAPVPANGTVATLATTRGERPFIDRNGNGVCDDADELLPVPEPYYDSNCNSVHDDGEQFVDLNDDGEFNADQGPGTRACSDQIVVFDSICTTFSAHTRALLIPSSFGALEAGGARDYTLIVSDNPDPLGDPGVGNPIVGGSRISVTYGGSRGKILGIGSFTQPDAFTNNQIFPGVNRFEFTLVDNNPASTTAEADAVTVTISSEGLAAGGNGSVILSSGVTFLAAPTPTPTLVPTPVPTPTPSPTPVPPALLPTQTTLAVGSGAPPSACNGGTQPFVVTGGAPPFTVFAGGGCVSATSIPASGGSFIFTAGNTLGSFSVTVTDALGRTASAGVLIQGLATPTFTFTPTDTPTPPFTATPTVTATPTKTATATSTPVPRSISFVSAAPASIGVRGSGLAEQSLLTFRVTDALAQPIAGIPVEFTLTSLGGESIEPLGAVTDDAGLVSTVLSSGNRAASVRVTATVVGDASVTTRSTAVSIVSGEPAANGFTMAAQFLNIAGRVTAGLQDVVTVFAHDRFGNAVPAGTAVTFQTDGGSLVNITPTDAQGQARATLVSEGSVRPNGIVTLLAYSRGEKAFTDLNGNGVPDAGEPVAPLPEPFFDRNGNGTRDADEPFIDTNNDGVWNLDQDPVGQFSNQVLVFTTGRVTFSGATIALLDPQSFEIEDGGSAPVTLLLSDDNNNPLVSGTKVKVEVTTQDVKLRGIPDQFTLADTESFNQFADGINRFRFFVDDALPNDGDVPKQVAVKVTIESPVTGEAPGGNGDRTAFSNGILKARPTPTRTFTETPTVTATPSPVPTSSPIPTITNTFPPSPTVTNSATPPPTATPQPPGAIQFVLFPQPTQIGVRGSGRPEQSILTFKVTDPDANPLGGVRVTFSVTGDGDETVSPTEAFSDGFGFARTTLASGTRAGTARVVAAADSNGDSVPDLFAQSTAVAVVGAPPVSGRVSLGSQKLNFPGRVRLGQSVEITALFNDRFGNAVPEGTAITFITNGGAILGQIPTGPGGAATALLTAEAPFTSTGVVTVMAYTRGEEAFLDNNGNGVFDAGTDSITGDNTPEPFIDFRPLPPADSGCSVVAPSPRCNNAFEPDKPFELFVDTGVRNGSWDTQGTPGVWDDNILVFGSTSVTMSGPLGTPVLTPDSVSIPAGGSQDFTIVISDDLGNPLALGSHVVVNVGAVEALDINTGGEQSFNQLVDGFTRFHFTLTNGASTSSGTFAITVDIQSDNGSATFTVGSVTFEAAP